MEFVSIEEDPRYVQGKIFLREKNFEDAIELLSSLLQSCIEKFGELSIQCARAYYEYGNALLTKEEENPSHGLLGDMDNKNEDAQDEGNNDNEGGDGEKQEEEGDEGDEGEEGGEDEDVQDDLQIAWEVLDVARSILVKSEGANKNPLLADIQLRLGDLMQFNENIAGAIEEYLQALAIKAQCCKPYDREIASIHYSIGTAHVYNAKEPTTQDPIGEKQKALEHYIEAKRVLAQWIELSEDKKEQDVGEVQELLDVLDETIDAIRIELKEEEKCANQAKAPVTTIGFGASSASSSSSSAAAPINTLQSTEKNSGKTSRPEEVNTLAVKKRKTSDEGK